MSKFARLASVVAITASSLLLAGCYVTSEPLPPPHHPRRCRKMVRTRRVCVKVRRGECVRWKRREHVRWDC